jgi:acyl-CoA thioesterase-1
VPLVLAATQAAPAVAASAAQAATQTTRPAGGTSTGTGKILVVGDSLSAEYGLARGTGWVALLTRRIEARKLPFTVVNASISGETTSGGRTRLPALLERHTPAIVVLELGGNDALRGLPLTATEANLREMARAARQAGARPLVLGMMMPPNYGRAYGEQFAAIFKRVADAEKAPLVPFFLEGIGDRMDMFQADRIHPTEAAQPILLDNVWPTLERMLKAK